MKIKTWFASALFALLSVTSLSLRADEWWWDEDDNGYVDVVVMAPFVVNGNDSETFDWTGYFDFLDNNDIDYYEGDPFQIFYGAGSTGTGPMGNYSTNNTYPYNQTSNAACGVNTVRNLIHIMKSMDRSEREIADKMATKVGDYALNVFGEDGPGITKPLTQFNAGLNDYGLKATSTSWSNTTTAAAVFADLQSRGECLIAVTAVNGSISGNHVVVLQPFMDGSTLKVREIDSGVANNGNATVTVLSTYDATFVPVGGSSGQTGNIYRISAGP